MGCREFPRLAGFLVRSMAGSLRRVPDDPSSRMHREGLAAEAQGPNRRGLPCATLETGAALGKGAPQPR